MEKHSKRQIPSSSSINRITLELGFHLLELKNSINTNDIDLDKISNWYIKQISTIQADTRVNGLSNFCFLFVSGI